MVGWKHREVTIEIAKLLKKDGINFYIEIIGEGLLKEKIQNLIVSNELQDYVVIKEAVPSKQVREKIRKFDIV